MAAVLTGLDRVANSDADVIGLLHGRRVGLLAHPASVDVKLCDAHSILVGAGAKVCALFGPEHGFVGAAQDMISVDSTSDSNIEIHSLYGSSENDLLPKQAWLKGLDALVIDLQDVGSRYYTYVWTAALMLKAATEVGVECIVLDRPNPLGGERIEGAKQRQGYRSFVGLYDIPIRHGLTIAELLMWVADLEGIDAQALTCVSMHGWHRSMYWEQTGLPWVIPSPNMPTMDTAVVYPGGCLIEGTKLSEGRGTTRPFEIWGSPSIDARKLLIECEGARLRPLCFQPTFQKHTGTLCNGVQVHVENRKLFSPVACYLRLLKAALRQLDATERWRTEAYEFVTDRPAIDLLTGGSEFRQLVDAGDELGDYLEAQERGASQFARERQPFLMYR